VSRGSPRILPACTVLARPSLGAGSALLGQGRRAPKGLDGVVLAGPAGRHRRVPRRAGTSPEVVVHSFEPVGLVAKAVLEDGYLKHIKTDPDLIGSALTGALLAATEHQPCSLSQVFSKTARQASSADRSPVRRLDILRTLIAAGGPVSQAELMRTSGIRNAGGITSIVDALAAAGLITYRTSTTYAMKSSHRLDGPVTVGPRSRPLSLAVAAYPNARTLSRATPMVVTATRSRTTWSCCRHGRAATCGTRCRLLFSGWSRFSSALRKA
jgi:hypothetical protein